jgi:hypothetical protein
VGSNPTLSATSTFALVTHEAPAPLTPAAAIAAALAPRLPLYLGSLCVWGDWFGRPMDNQHTAVAVRHVADELTIEFSHRELLTVRRPEKWQLDPDAAYGQSRFAIRRAERVDWTWYLTGHLESPEMVFLWQHWREGGRIKALTTVEGWGPLFAPRADEPAVNFL